MKSIRHQLLIKAPVRTVFEAITTQQGIAGWWTPYTKATPELNTITRVEFDNHYHKELEVVELKPYTHLTWLVKKATDEWIGSTISFDIEPNKKGAILSFKHDGWKEYTDMFARCTYDWGLFLRSLRLLCETGTGRPFPDFE